MNDDALIKLSRTRPAARKLLDAILAGGMSEERTTVDELIGLGEVTRRQAITVLRNLAEFGCGEFKVGRKGHPSRLEWSVDPREVAERVVEAEASEDHGEQLAEREQGAAELDELGRKQALSPVAPSQAAFDLGDLMPGAPANEGPPRPGQARAAESEGQDIEHSYVLRPDFRLSVRLPADLTRREAEVLGEWIRNLSFER